ncbi:MAG: hypothetical protein Greene07147_749, partial [Parcubacteria group bacterium Greene0714_7]
PESPVRNVLPPTVSAVVDAYGNVDAMDVVAVKYAATACPTTESFAYGEVVPMPRLPEKYATCAFGSNQYFAEVVALPPMVTMSVEFRG